MNFFEQQKQARKESKVLWVLFLVAVVAIIVAVNLAALAGYEIYSAQNQSDYSTYGNFDNTYSSGEPTHTEKVILTCSLATLITIAIIFLGSIFKTSALRFGGGGYVAKSLGGRRIEMDTTDPQEKRLVNVVEEMAIASGTNVPSIWVMDHESGINAFAAGYAPSEAAVCVSQGCLNELTRDELQGVIAHEFSHIFNGDMRANIRMLGLLHGILVIGLTGYWAVRVLGHSRPRSSSSSSGNKRDNAAAVLLAVMVVGVLLIIIGYIGVFFGRVIKASLSRTREYLADASAVQFTRNPNGIAGALAKIHHGSGSRLESTSREQFSHFFFADGVGFFLPFFETHPPLPKRLERILPNWEQVFEKDKGKPAESAPPLQKMANHPSGRTLDSIGRTAWDQVAYAKELLDGMPSLIHKLSAVPQGAKLLMVGLLNVEHAAIPAALAGLAAEFPSEALKDAHQRLRDMGEKSWFPVANMCMPSIQRLGAADRKAFSDLCSDIVQMDGTTTTFEASILSILQRSLATPNQKRKVSHASLSQVRSQLFSLAAILASETSSDEQACYQAFRKGLDHANLPGYIPEHLPQVTVEAMPQLLRVLAQTSPEIKEVTMSLLVEVVKADGQATDKEKEILRTVAATLECPIPPFV
jgi:Zn-dependent protease with chaperone function